MLKKEEALRFLPFLASHGSEEIKKLQRRFSAVEKADNYFFGEIRYGFISLTRRRGDKIVWSIRFEFLCLLGRRGIDKIVWSVRFRRARRTIVRRAAKSGAEKAKTLNFKQESVRIPDTWARGEIKKMQKR